MLRDEKFRIFLLVSVCLVLFFARLGDIPLYDNDEGLHAVTSKDMVLSHDWVTTTFNGEVFYDKPVLYNWLAAISFLILGFTEFAARLPAALLGLGSVLVTYVLGRRMGGPLLGFLGGMILATSPEFITLSRVVVHDISLVFFVTLALCLFYFGFTASSGRKRYFLPFYAAAGFAVLAKGPVGLLLPGAIIGLFLLLRGRLGFIKHMSLGWGVPVFLVVVAPWYVLISIENPGYAGYFFIQQNLMNFVSSAKARHPEAFYYYLPVLLGGFLPWSMFLPIAIANPLRRGFRQLEDGPLFLLLWFAVVLIFFSSAASKLSTYILPLYPAVALLAAYLFARLMEAPTPALKRAFVFSCVPLVVMFGLAILYAMMFPPTILESNYGIDLTAGNYLLVLLTVISLFALYALVRGWPKTFFASHVTLVMSGILVFLFAFVPSMDAHRTTKEIALRWDADLAAGQKLVFFRRIRDTALFYTDRQATEVHQLNDLVEHLLGEDNPHAFIEKKYYDKVELLTRISEVIHREGDGLLIRARSFGSAGG